ncbi:hypothetical protein K4749_07920 [Streptomyces sp. TRM72054]|uniref:hypothetical protein n=1 Tax=Streptomyces sp. TRM72054 TaxID=2870562 RepID=UPI001C8C7505|nr:hypothetical protein [Streptomyces sp. TRM72054]MBX9393520.1 hypothetical protein [Streptomyces sp. TRM72054]
MHVDDDARLDTSEVRGVRGSRITSGRATVGGGLAGLPALLLGLGLLCRSGGVVSGGCQDE